MCGWDRDTAAGVQRDVRFGVGLAAGLEPTWISVWVDIWLGSALGVGQR